MKLQPQETVIKGNWIVEGKKVRGDADYERIEWLVAHHLIQIAGGGWETLFKDTDDGRYWEQIYPQSEMHGGGPPTLRLITKNDANVKYGAVIS